jgi:hypothetical protein
VVLGGKVCGGLVLVRVRVPGGKVCGGVLEEGKAVFSEMGEGSTRRCGLL